jgi:hypothetical protein
VGGEEFYFPVEPLWFWEVYFYLSVRMLGQPDFRERYNFLGSISFVENRSVAQKEACQDSATTISTTVA